MTLLVKEILRAVDDGDLGRTRELLSREPALASARGDHGVTPLHAAAEKNHAAIATELLDTGADIEAETTWGMTPLAWAANMGSRDVGDLLISRGARLNLWAAAGLGLLDKVHEFVPAPGQLEPGAAQKRYRQDGQGNWQTLAPPEGVEDALSDAFYIACRNGQTQVARFLLEHGADVDSRGFFGGTALHWAAVNGHRETVEFLLDNGARTDLKDDQFDATALGWARESDQAEIARLLESK